MATLEMDYFEYATDGAAQAAYVTNATAIASTGSPTITTDGLYTVYKFTSSGTFVPILSGNVEVLVVAGGGSGGKGAGGGGGAGGLVYNASYAITAQTYTVTIGPGGPEESTAGDNVGNDGTNSVFGTITAIGGGGGGTYNGIAGRAGGSGGGGGYSNGVGGDADYISPRQGYDGGTASTNGAGGGGAGAVGYSGNHATYPSQGGDGLAYDILVDSSNIYYAGGGGGAWGTPGGGAGGLGGGGTGSKGGTPTAGTPNTGGGGGGGDNTNGYAGGSGIVIVRFLTSSQSSILQSYSGTEKVQGTYSLKVEATITDSATKTLTKTFTVNSNLTGVKNLRFDVYALRTGSNFKIGLHDTGGTTTEITPVISTSNTWQTVKWDLSAVSDANKDNIDTCILTITNADSANTIYLDNFIIAQAIDIFGIVG
jgi:hypothetical protein